MGRRFDYVITLCDKVRGVYPELPGHPEPIHCEGGAPPPRARSSRLPRLPCSGRRPAQTRADSSSKPSRRRHPPGKEHCHRQNDGSIVNVVPGRGRASRLKFYTTHLGFTLRTAHLPAFADVTRGNLRLLLRAGQFRGPAMPDGRRPVPGGWNQIHLIVAESAHPR